MSEYPHMPSESERKAPWRDPLSVGWQAHRLLLLLRLHWHDSSSRRHRVGGHQR